MTFFTRPRALKARIERDYRAYRLAPTLASSMAPDTLAAERDFDKLQAAFPPLPEYGYDDVSLGQRAAERLANSFAYLPRDDRRLATLDVGTGDGTLGVMLASLGHEVTLSDLEDWRRPAAKTLPFSAADCCAGLPFPPDRFDLVTSFNSFEHMADPAAAIAEITRVTRPGGIIHLDFGPLFASPWGLHAYRTFMMPYPQFLFSPDFIAAKLKAMGISDLGADRTELQYVNRWLPHQYQAAWKLPELELISSYTHCVQSYWKFVAQYPGSFRGRGLTYEHLITANLKVVFRKRTAR